MALTVVYTSLLSQARFDSGTIWDWFLGGQGDLLAPGRVNNDVHAPLADVVLVSAADTHRHADHAELPVTEAERHGTQRMGAGSGRLRRRMAREPAGSAERRAGTSGSAAHQTVCGALLPDLPGTTAQEWPAAARRVHLCPNDRHPAPAAAHRVRRSSRRSASRGTTGQRRGGGRRRWPTDGPDRGVAPMAARIASACRRLVRSSSRTRAMETEGPIPASRAWSVDQTSAG